MAKRSLVIAGSGGLAVLGGAVAVLLSGTPITPVTLDFDVGLQKPVAEVHGCLRSAGGLRAWWAAAGGADTLPTVSVSEEDGAYLFTANGQLVETWVLATETDDTVTYTVTSGKVTMTRSLQLTEADDGGSTLTWNEQGRVPALGFLSLMGNDGDFAGFLDAGEALDAAACPNH